MDIFESFSVHRVVNSIVVVSGLYFVWLAFRKLVSSSKGMADIPWLSRRWSGVQNHQ